MSSGPAQQNPLDSRLASLTIMVNDMAHRRQLRVNTGLVVAGHCQLSFCGHYGYKCTKAKNWSAPNKFVAEIKDGDELTADFGHLGSVCMAIRDSKPIGSDWHVLGGETH